MATSGLHVVEQAQIPGPADPQTIAFCDAHDLVAVLDTADEPEHAATVYRLKGETAFTLALRDDDELRPVSIQWKPDGSLLAVTWSDDVCCLYSGESGKLLYELPSRSAAAGNDSSWTLDVNARDPGNDFDDGETAATNAAWHPPITWTAYGDGPNGESRPGAKAEDISTDDFFEIMTGGGSKGKPLLSDRSDSAMSDLVNSVTTLDTTDVLPRLGKIETATGMRYSPAGNKFSTQTSTDIIFDASTFAPGIFNTLLASDSHGCITVFVDETIKVGHIQLPCKEQIRSASRSGVPSQVILTRRVEDMESFQLNYVNLPLEQLGSPLNYVVSLNTRRVQSLMAYITHTIRCVHQEIQTGVRGVPTRLMKLLDEDLRTAAGEGASEPANIVTIELQHLALTSSFHPAMLEWLKDIVKETGHKRWDQAVNAMYDHIQSYLFKNLLPALQRFVTAACALRGQARYHQHTGKFGVRLDVFASLIEWADMVGILAQKTLQTVTEEHVQFRAFSKWLRVMIDVAVAGPGSKGADETEERESPNYEMDLVLRYINGPLMDSRLKVLAEAISPAGVSALSKDDFFRHPMVTGLSRDGMVAALQTLDSNDTSLAARDKAHPATPHPSDPINLPLLTCLLQAHTRVALDEINAWQAQAVPRPPEIVPLTGRVGRTVWGLSICPPDAFSQKGRVTRLPGQVRDLVFVLCGSFGLQPDRSLMLHRIERYDDSETPWSIQKETLGPGDPVTRILHAVLLPPELTDYVQPQILVLAMTRDEADNAETPVLFLRNPNDYDWHTLHAWPASPSRYLSSPSHFLVGGRPGKRVVVVFSPAGRGTRWEALDFESIGRARGGEFARATGDVDME